jgi:NAD(P) transhydrogenase subunit alpha
MLALLPQAGALPTVLGALGIFIAAINIAGGFLVTQRMLAMFRKK